MSGVVDYTLAKRRLLADLRRGVVRRPDVCDAHPELMRAARNIGRPLPSDCPICEAGSLRLVRYVYGDQLRHLSGRPVYPDGWVEELEADHDEFRCYSIEVCLDCSWNHISACQMRGRRFNAAGRPLPNRLA